MRPLKGCDLLEKSSRPKLGATALRTAQALAAVVAPCLLKISACSVTAGALMHKQAADVHCCCKSGADLAK